LQILTVSAVDQVRHLHIVRVHLHHVRAVGARVRIDAHIERLGHQEALNHRGLRSGERDRLYLHLLFGSHTAPVEVALHIPPGFRAVHVVPGEGKPLPRNVGRDVHPLVRIGVIDFNRQTSHPPRTIEPLLTGLDFTTVKIDSDVLPTAAGVLSHGGRHSVVHTEAN